MAQALVVATCRAIRASSRASGPGRVSSSGGQWHEPLPGGDGMQLRHLSDGVAGQRNPAGFSGLDVQLR